MDRNNNSQAPTWLRYNAFNSLKRKWVQTLVICQLWPWEEKERGTPSKLRKVKLRKMGWIRINSFVSILEINDPQN